MIRFLLKDFFFLHQRYFAYYFSLHVIMTECPSLYTRKRKHIFLFFYKKKIDGRYFTMENSMLFRVVNLLLFLFVALALSLFNEKFIKFKQVWFQAVFPVNRHKIRHKHKIYFALFIYI